MSGKPTTAAVRRASRPQPAADARAQAQQHRAEVALRLRRVEGQIRGVLALLEREASCETVAQQLAAARKALDRAFFQMMACSLEMEVDTSDRSQLRQRIAETAQLLAKYA